MVAAGSSGTQPSSTTSVASSPSTSTTGSEVRPKRPTNHSGFLAVENHGPKDAKPSGQGVIQNGASGIPAVFDGRIRGVGKLTCIMLRETNVYHGYIKLTS